MLQQVVNDLYQVGESVEGSDGWHEAVRVYVLLNDGCPLIFDAGSHIHRDEIMADLRSLLGDTTPGFVFLTHTELPHTGNLGAIHRTWPETKYVVSSGILPHVEMPWWVPAEQICYGHPGTSELFGGRKISFSDAILKDQPGTYWLYDDATGTIFTADAFGYFFQADASQKFCDELDEGVPVEWFRLYHQSAFRFLSMVSSEKVNKDLERVFSVRDVRVIAPTHGNAIRSDVNTHLDRVCQSIEEICA